MAVVVSLLRGINLGPRHKIKMDDLRALYVSLGLTDPRTYIQSGNVVFGTKQKNPAELAVTLNEAIAQRYGFRADVVLRTLPELRELTGVNRFAARGLDPARNLVIFLSAALSADAAASICSICSGPEEMHSDGRHLHCYYPDGMGRSKLPLAIERELKKVKIMGTARNWNTVLKLIEMAEDLEAE